jgi:hypothetical protein
MESAIRLVERGSGLPITAELSPSEASVVQALVEYLGGEGPIRLVNVQGRWLDWLDGEWTEADGCWRSLRDGHRADREAA